MNTYLHCSGMATCQLNGSISINNVPNCKTMLKASGEH